jgi:ribosomal protein S18 acetylase RimI-like enzyme
MLRFRDYKKEDYPDILSLWKATGMGDEERGDDHAQIEKTLNADGKLIVMLLDDKIIGTSWVTNDTRRLYLHHFGILPEHQGKGYSHSLMNETAKYIKEKNMQVKLEVKQENTLAINLYKKHGFSRLGDFDVMIVRNPQKL